MLFVTVKRISFADEHALIAFTDDPGRKAHAMSIAGCTLRPNIIIVHRIASNSSRGVELNAPIHLLLRELDEA